MLNELLFLLYQESISSQYFIPVVMGTFILLLFIILIMKFRMDGLAVDLNIAEDRLMFERGKNSRILEENRLLVSGMKAMADNRFTIFLREDEEDEEYYDDYDDEDDE